MKLLSFTFLITLTLEIQHHEAKTARKNPKANPDWITRRSHLKNRKGNGGHYNAKKGLLLAKSSGLFLSDFENRRRHKLKAVDRNAMKRQLFPNHRPHTKKQKRGKENVNATKRWILSPSNRVVMQSNIRNHTKYHKQEIVNTNATKRQLLPNYLLEGESGYLDRSLSGNIHVTNGDPDGVFIPSLQSAKNNEEVRVDESGLGRTLVVPPHYSANLFEDQFINVPMPSLQTPITPPAKTKWNRNTRNEYDIMKYLLRNQPVGKIEKASPDFGFLNEEIVLPNGKKTKGEKSVKHLKKLMKEDEAISLVEQYVDLLAEPSATKMKLDTDGTLQNSAKEKEKHPKKKQRKNADHNAADAIIKILKKLAESKDEPGRSTEKLHSSLSLSKDHSSTLKSDENIDINTDMQDEENMSNYINLFRQYLNDVQLRQKMFDSGNKKEQKEGTSNDISTLAQELDSKYITKPIYENEDVNQEEKFIQDLPNLLMHQNAKYRLKNSHNLKDSQPSSVMTEVMDNKIFSTKLGNQDIGVERVNKEDKLVVGDVMNEHILFKQLQKKLKETLDKQHDLSRHKQNSSKYQKDTNRPQEKEQSVPDMNTLDAKPQSNDSHNDIFNIKEYINASISSNDTNRNENKSLYFQLPFVESIVNLNTELEELQNYVNDSERNATVEGKSIMSPGNLTNLSSMSEHHVCETDQWCKKVDDENQSRNSRVDLQQSNSNSMQEKEDGNLKDQPNHATAYVTMPNPTNKTTIKNDTDRKLQNTEYVATNNPLNQTKSNTSGVSTSSESHQNSTTKLRLKTHDENERNGAVEINGSKNHTAFEGTNLQTTDDKVVTLVESLLRNKIRKNVLRDFDFANQSAIIKSDEENGMEKNIIFFARRKKDPSNYGNDSAFNFEVIQDITSVEPSKANNMSCIVLYNEEKNSSSTELRKRNTVYERGLISTLKSQFVYDMQKKTSDDIETKIRQEIQKILSPNEYIGSLGKTKTVSGDLNTHNSSEPTLKGVVCTNNFSNNNESYASHARYSNSDNDLLARIHLYMFNVRGQNRDDISRKLKDYLRSVEKNVTDDKSDHVPVSGKHSDERKSKNTIKVNIYLRKNVALVNVTDASEEILNDGSVMDNKRFHRAMRAKKKTKQKHLHRKRGKSHLNDKHQNSTELKIVSDQMHDEDSLDSKQTKLARNVLSELLNDNIQVKNTTSGEHIGNITEKKSKNRNENATDSELDFLLFGHSDQSHINNDLIQDHKNVIANKSSFLINDEEYRAYRRNSSETAILGNDNARTDNASSLEKNNDMRQNTTKNETLTDSERSTGNQNLSESIVHANNRTMDADDERINDFYVTREDEGLGIEKNNLNQTGEKIDIIKNFYGMPNKKNSTPTSDRPKMINQTNSVTVNESVPEHPQFHFNLSHSIFDVLHADTNRSKTSSILSIKRNITTSKESNELIVASKVKFLNETIQNELYHGNNLPGVNTSDDYDLKATEFKW